MTNASDPLLSSPDGTSPDGAEGVSPTDRSNSPRSDGSQAAGDGDGVGDEQLVPQRRSRHGAPSVPGNTGQTKSATPAPVATTADGLPVRRIPGASARQLPGRSSASHTLRPSGRHRRAVPAALPQSAPALILAVPGTPVPDDPQRPRPPHAQVISELATVLSLDNPAIDVRVGWIDGANADPGSLSAALTDVAEGRASEAAAAVVVPLIAAPHARVMAAIRDVIERTGVNAAVGEFVNANPLLAEALHIRLAEAGLARADRVRLFSIVTAADGLVVATVGGTEALQSASITSFLLSARLAIPVLTASLDGSPSIEEAALRLKEMGATRLAIAPCIIGPELVAQGIKLDEVAIGAECSVPLGAHGNVVKLVATAYGQAISDLEMSLT